MKIELRVLSEEEMADYDLLLQRSLLQHAWHLWQVQSCEERGGHWWWLQLDPDDGVDLRCLHCPADVDDVYPDGHDLMYGEFEVFPGYRLSLDFGSVLVNGEDRGGFMYGWRGAVTVDLRVEEHRSYFNGSEWDVWVDLEAA